MNRLFGGATLLVALVVLAPSAPAVEDKPTIKDIMTKAHKGGDSILAKIGKELKSDDPTWADVKSGAAELVKLGGSLAKATPDKGEKASWDKQTKSYSAKATTLKKAADSMDKAAAAKALKGLTTSCKACHSVHK
jgi:cytochrome c556